MVGMPQLDESILHRSAIGVENASRDIRYDACCSSQVVVQLNQVIVLIKGNVISERVEGTWGGQRRGGKCLRDVSGHGESSGNCGHAFKEAPPVNWNVKPVWLCCFGLQSWNQNPIEAGLRLPERGLICTLEDWAIGPTRGVLLNRLDRAEGSQKAKLQRSSLNSTV